ncbi:MAG: hypothetical protein K0V04_41525 [Deltaproteobacteria bacterium]|nr:hypothetical protein [Deltaproteobacteria bacterium]
MTRTATPLLALLLLSLPSCGKKTPTTTPPDGGDGTTTDGGNADVVTSDDPPAEPPPPQDPDPAELGPAIHQVLTGHYDDAIAALEPIYSGMREPGQERASGMAGGWIAVAHAQVVFENAEAPAAHALEMAGKLQDPEVDAVSRLGRGAFLLAQEDYAAAKEAFEGAAAAAPGTAPSVYAQLLLAETLIGTAFGSASNTQVEKPEDLDAAKAAYEGAVQGADSAKGERDILMGRAKEGLAAIAKYQRDTKALCDNAFAALDHYQAAKASTFLLDGPSRLASDAKCEQ